MAAPDLRAAVRHGAAAPRGDGASGWPSWSRPAASRSRPTRTSSTSSRSSAATRSTSASTRRCPASGFARDEWAKPPTALSGGEQTRATLARLVIAQPDLLLLDEPTNHLDIGAIEWLEEHLRRRHGALLVASHDRAFLDATVGRIWELRDRRLTAFRGDYSAYHRQREERDARAVKDADSQADAIDREKELVQRYRSHRKFSKMHEHEARLERLQADRVETPKSVAEAARCRPGRSPAAGRRGRARSSSGSRGSSSATCRVVAPSTRTAARRRSRDASRAAPFLAAQRGDRIGIVGPNGAGKTTLLRTIAGDLPPLDGALTFGNAVQPGYLAQLRDSAIPGATVLDALLEAIPITPGEARAYLARFLFRGDDVFKEVRSLSGGERSRLELALLGIMPSNLLLLDEPTNHLDIPAREAIESFLRRIAGDAARRVARPAAARDRLLRACGWSTTGWRCRSTAAGRPGGRRWPRAGRSHAAAERERRRLRVPVAAASAASTVGPPCRRSGPAVAAGHERVDPEGPGRGGSAPGRSREKLSKDAYRRQKTTVDAELTRLGLRKTPARAVDGLAGDLRQLRRDAAGRERARRRRAGAGGRRGRLARARGARAVTNLPTARERPDAGHRPDRARSAAARPPSPAGSPTGAPWSSTPTSSRAR